MKKIKIALNINDKACEIMVAPNDTLLEVLREELDLTGAKRGCDEGVCGSCTVHMNKKPVRACLTLALEAEGADIRTVEGLANGDDLSELQESFIRHGAVQCGFCTPGILMSTRALLEENPQPERDEIVKAISGNLCRCTGYQSIIGAINAAATGLSKKGKNSTTEA